MTCTRTLLSLMLGLLGSQCTALAQSCSPGNSCFTAPLLCGSVLNGYSTATGPQNDITQPSTFCGVIENNQWLRFVACAPSVTLQLNVASCAGTFTGSGLQAQIFQTSDCQIFTPVSNCFNPGSAASGTLVANGLTPGQIYYLMVDGWAGDICQYSIAVLAGVDTNPPTPQVQTPGSVTGDQEVCPGQTAVYQASLPQCGNSSASGCPLPQLPANQYNYTWNLPPGASVSGNPNSTTVTVTWGNTGGNITVTATPTGNSMPCGCNWQCPTDIPPLPVQVVSSPVQVDTLAPIVLCQGESATVCGATYSTSTFVQCVAQDCNNATIQPIQVLPLTSTDLGIKYLCNGDCFVYNGEEFCQTGYYERTIKSGGLCELVKVTINATEIDCYYPQPPTLHPSMPSVTLTGDGSSSNGPVTYSWSGPGIDASNQHLQEPSVSAGGTYVVTVTDPLSGCTHTCEVIVKSQPHDCNLPAPPSNFCETAPLFCGEEFDGFCSFTGDFAGEYPGNLGSVFCHDIQNSAWMKFLPCEDSVAIQIKPSECQFGFGIEAAIFSTSDCQTFTLRSQCAQTDAVTPILLSAGGLTPGQAYFLFVDGQAGDFCRWDIRVKHGISTKPIKLVQNSPPLVSGPTEMCPTQIGTYTLTLPDCQAQNEDGCPLDALAQDFSIKWFAPAGATIVGDNTQPTVQVRWDDTPGGDVFAIVNSVLNADQTYCLAENSCGSFAKLAVEVDFKVKVLPKIEICRGDSVEFCGNFYKETKNPFCLDTCQKTIQPIRVYDPINIDLGKIRICPDDCYLFENQPYCQPGQYNLIAQTNVCPDTTHFEIEIIQEQNLELSAVKRTCDGFGVNYRVSFEVLTGEPPFFVNGQPLPGNNFLSPPIVSEEDYLFTVTHAGICNDTTIVLTGAKNCECQSRGGLMAQDTLFACPGNTVTATHLGGQFLDEDDDFLFVLHDGADTLLQGIIALDTLGGTFGFDPAKMTLGHTYYISYVAANAIDGGYIDLADRCLSVAPGQPLVFYPPPLADVTAVPTLDCDDPEVLLKGSGSSGSGTFQYGWSGPGAFSATTKNAQIDMPGDYAFVVTDAKTGCSASDMATVAQNIAAPDISSAGATLTCTNPTATLTGNSTATGVKFWWKNPAGDSLPGKNCPASDFGFYQFFVRSNVNGCVSDTVVEVLDGRIFPQIALLDDTLTCVQISKNLKAQVEPSGSQFLWSGPGGFSSILNSPNVSFPGDYVLVATEPTSGCTRSDTLSMAENKAVPDVFAPDSALTCALPSLLLRGESPVSDAIFWWEMPTGDTIPGAVLNIAQVGLYQIFVSDPANGCTASHWVEIVDGRIFPQIQTAPDTLTCARTSIDLQANVFPAGGQFNWQGPNGFSSSEPDPTATEPGIYNLTVTDSGSGCTSVSDLTLRQDIAPPGISATGATITCREPLVTIRGLSPAPGTVFWWENPAGDSLPGAFLTTDSADFYHVFAQNPANGCISQAEVEVGDGRVFPQLTTIGGQVTCRDPQTTLHTAAFPPVLDFQWIGPGGFSENTASPTVEQPGLYTLTTTEPTSGCTASDTAWVADNRAAPLVSAGVTEELTCDRRSVWLYGTGSSEGPEFIYLWWSANGYTLEPQDSMMARASAPDIYTLLVTNTLNGCTASTNVTVTENANRPTAAETDVLPPSCFGENDALLSILDIVGGVPPLEFALDTGAFSDKTVFVDLRAGDYTLTVRDANGCTFQQTISVLDPPEVRVDIGDNFDVDLGEEITLRASFSVPYADLTRIKWHSNAGDTLGHAPAWTLRPFQTADYFIFVSNANGCSDEDFVRVRVERKVPVYVPNVFSPNGDGTNDLLTVYGGTGVERALLFEVFDRWGELVFSRADFAPNDPNVGWDGHFRGKTMSPGVFAWRLSVQLVDGRVLDFFGDVAIAN